MIKQVIYTIIILTFSTGLTGQNLTNLSKSEKKTIITKLTELIKENYVFPQKTDSIVEELTNRFQLGIYDTLTTYNTFSAALNSDIRTISKDYHFMLTYNPSGLISKKELNRRLGNRERFLNYGMSKLEIREGNIGYLKLDFFARHNRKAYKAAFSFLTNANGIIIDLRDNNGGDKKMVGLLASYFLKEKTLLATVKSPKNKDKKISTERFVRKGKMAKIPMVILISRNTFSAAEFFSYSLKNLDRATIIGETTGGGAHPTQRYAVTDSLFLFVPIAQVINPLTKSNWEGKGVIPDMQSSYQNAVTDGHLWLLRELKNTTTLESEKDYYEQIIKKIK
jgi:C-terminal processing protease CtpA/Prc